MRRFNLLVASVAALSLACPAAAQYHDDLSDASHQEHAAHVSQPTGPAAPVPAQIDDLNWQTELGFEPEAFRSHVLFLGDDLLEGREAGTRGHELAARYVASQFAGLGVLPGNGDSWFQSVRLGRGTLAGDPRLTIGDRVFTYGQSFIFTNTFTPQPVSVNAPLVFVGYGIDAPAQGHDDYRGLDVRNKVVVVVGGLPQGLPSDVATHLGAARAQMAASRGAVGMIVLRPPSATAMAPLANTANALRRQTVTTWVNQRGGAGPVHQQLRFTATGDAELASAIFAGAPRTWDQIAADVAAGRRPAGFALRPTVRAERAMRTETFTSPNVVGIIPGTDPSVANEYVLLMAHLDGVGMVPEGGDQQPNASTGAGTGDRIRNGAMDNSTGVATLIEVARKFRDPANRPRRPILLAAVTAEEKGLLGAGFLASNPVVNGRVVGLVNLDMPILTYNFEDVVAFGAEHSEMGPMVRRAAEAMGVRLSNDPLPEQGLFTRSDHYPFVQQGIPAVFLMTGFANGGEERFRGFLENQYHSVRDDLTLPFDWRAGARFAELNYRITRELANAPAAPRWYRGSFFGDTLGGNQPRAARPAAAATGSN